MSWWIIFREVYTKVIVSILLVIGAMLILQSSLNQLKLRSLAAEATSSRLQISAAAIERAIVRADSLGFAIDEMTGLQDLIDRERARDDTIARIVIVSPIGAPIMTSGAIGFFADEQDQVLRRVLGSGDTLTRLDTGPHLYTGRLLFDSSAAVMGAVILVTPTETFIAQARAAMQRMTYAYLAVFAVISILVAPFIVFQFSSVRHAYSALVAEVDQTNLQHTPEAEALHDAIAAGNVAFQEAEQEFEGLLGKASRKGGAA
ncbi:hypothetical protein [Thalassobacter stenotrophicus]|uniref:hypothetical protein n=1 Tax=Thalassobacter stenotrophicus TaxID=266809 RepID=UPI0010578AD4|nr:hypothetical protein [Thalassobacter stenotrophicus]